VGEGIYRVPAPKPPVPPDPYLLAWASLRRRRVTMWISFLTWLPVAGVATRLLGDLALLIVLPHVATFIVSTFIATYFRCPHCRELFAKKSAFEISTPNELAVRGCVNCDIRVGTPRSAVVASATNHVGHD
jgi:hypothetical protein